MLLLRHCSTRAPRKLTSSLTSSLSLSTATPRPSFSLSPSPSASPRIAQTAIPVDEDGIPLSPPFSIRDLLSSLPAPSLSDEQYIHLYTLSALTPPETGSEEFKLKKGQLEEMIRLVEGVREHGQEGTSHAVEGEIPDGRIWPEGDEVGIKLDWSRIRKRGSAAKKDSRASAGEGTEQAPVADGRELLKLAQKKHLAGYYTTPRKQRGDVE